MMGTTVQQQYNRQNTAPASDILVAILVNLKRQNGKVQLFIKINYNEFQIIFHTLLLDPKFQYLQNCFVFSYEGPVPFCPALQEAIEKLQMSGLICWPNLQEPDVMRLNPSAENYYGKELTEYTEERLAYQDIITAQQIAKRIMANWPELIVDRPHLMNC